MSIPNIPDVQGVIGKVTAGTSLLNAALVLLQDIPFDVKGSDNVGFLFAFREEDSADLRSDITDHFTETNTAIQDQIALKPIELSLHGYIGELTEQSDSGLLRKIDQIANQLGVLAAYVPDFTVQAMQAYNLSQQVINATLGNNTISQAFSFLPGFDKQTKQQKAYNFFETKWKDRALFTVQTPWAIFKDMALLSLKATQDGDTNTVSDFKITFKQMRFASTVASNTTITQGRLQAQSQPLTNQGFQNPPSAGPISLGVNTDLTQPKARLI